MSLWRVVGGKLGRCAHCMRLSFGVMAACWLILVALRVDAARSPQALLWIAALAAGLSTFWTALHGLAFVAREPARAAGCSTCAERIGRRRRSPLLRRLRRWLGIGRAGEAPRRRGRKACRNCGRMLPANKLDSARRADPGLRRVAEESEAFARLRPRLASSGPVDTWQEASIQYFLYELVADEKGRARHAVFVTRWEAPAPLAAVVVTPDPAGGRSGVENLMPAARAVPA